MKNVSRDVKVLTEAFQEFSLMMKDVVRYTRTQEFIQSNSTLTPVAQRSKDSSRSGSGSKRSRFADLNSESVLITSHDDSSAGENVPPIANGDAIEALIHGREIPRIESLKNLTLQDMFIGRIKEINGLRVQARLRYLNSEIEAVGVSYTILLL